MRGISLEFPRLRNDLYCVEWDVKLYYIIQSLEFYNGVGLEKSRTMSLPERPKSVPICPFVLIQYRHWTDGQTDRRFGKTISRSASIAC